MFKGFNTIFGMLGGGRGDFLSGLMSIMDAENKQQFKVKFGVTTVEGYEGVERLNIPHKYDSIELAKGQFDEEDKNVIQYLYCYSNRNQLITIYKTDGTFLFDGNRVEYYKQGMFLVGKKKEVVIVGQENHNDLLCSLYHEGEKITEPMFRPLNMSCFNEFGYATVGVGKNFNYAVINKSGEMLIQSDTLTHPYIYGVVCSYRGEYINLLTGNVICKYAYSSSVSTKEFMFIQVDSNCVYQINIRTGDFVVHGEVPKVEVKTESKINMETPRKPQVYEKKQNRNDLCKCGSGEKYKNCCISK